MAAELNDKRSEMNYDKTMNANSGSVAQRQDNKSSHEKEKVIEFREDSHTSKTQDTVTINGMHEIKGDKQDSKGYSQTQYYDLPSIDNNSLEDKGCSEIEFEAYLDDLFIDIVPGECPGTVDIFIVTIDDKVCDKVEKTIGEATIDQIEAIEREESANNYADIADQCETFTDLPEAHICQYERMPEAKDSEKVEVALCAKSTAGQATSLSNSQNTRQEKGIVILSRKSPNKSRKSQSSPCLSDSMKVDYCEPSKIKEDVKNHTHDTLHQPNETKHLFKRIQNPNDHPGKLKRFKGTSNLMVAKRQSASERGDFTYSGNDSEQKRGSIIDDVDDAIPRVIPRSGAKQVKFGDEIKGSRLIQPSPERSCPSEEQSPIKAEKPILKKGLSSVEPQVYYNSSYVDEDSDDRDSGLPEDEEYRPCPEYRDSRYTVYEYQDYHPASRDCVYNPISYQNGQYDAHAQSEYSIDSAGYGSPRSPSSYQNQHSHIADISVRQTPTPVYRNRDVYDDFYSVDSQYVRRSPGSYPWSKQTEVYAKENQYCLPTFDTNAFNNPKKTTGSKKKSNGDKKSRRDKKQQPRGSGRTETDIERYQRLLSTGQVRLVSRGSFDVRRIKLEYLLHIGDFSMKYKTEPSPLDSMTLTVYNETEGASVDVRRMLQMQSNFINRLRFCLRHDKEIWLLHRFLPIGALEVLMSRDPYREVLGEVHAQFITAGLLIGVNYLHQNGITHGNLYPWKVLINDRGYPVLTGFLPLVDGEDPVTSELRERRRYVFTVPYAAPDRFMGDMHPSVDIFSIGCIAYEIVAGRTPFDGGSEARTKEYILSYTYRPTYEYDMFSFAGEMFIDSCLRKPSAHRFMPGRHLANLYHEEWFSTLDLRRYEDQTLDSPILDTIQLLHTGETLDLEERDLDYDWGRVMDVVSPHTPTLVC